MKTDSLKEGYIGNHGRYLSVSFFKQLTCDVDSWYPDSGWWNPDPSASFILNGITFNVKKSLCINEIPAVAVGVGIRRISVISYIDSTRGLIRKAWKEINADRGQVDLIRVDKEAINASEVTRITDSLYKSTISDTMNKTAGEFAPFIIGNYWEYQYLDPTSGIRKSTKKIVAERSSQYLEGKRVYFLIKDSVSETSVSSYTDSLQENYQNRMCNVSAWYPNAIEKDSIVYTRFVMDGNKYSIYKTVCHDRTAPDRFNLTVIDDAAYVDSSRGLIHRYSNFTSTYNTGFCGEKVCQVEVKLGRFNGEDVRAETVKSTYDSINGDLEPK